MFQTLFGVNMSIFMGAMAPGSEVTFFLAGTSVSTLSVTIQSKKFSISVIALFDYCIVKISHYIFPITMFNISMSL